MKPNIQTAAKALLVTAALATPAFSQSLTGSFVSPDDDSYRRLGFDLASDGDTIFAGGDGFVEIWDRTPAGPVYRETLETPNPDVGSYGFGRSIDAGNGFLLVGALGEDVSGAQTSGRVYVYQEAGGVYGLVDTLSTGGQLAQFGWALDLSSDANTAVISSPGAGTVYFYERSSTTFSMVREVTFASGGGGRGSSIFVEGERAFIGDPYTDRVRCFERNGGAWTRVQTISDGIDGNQQFGWSLEATDRFLVIGMPSYEPAGSTIYVNSGGAQIFENIGGSWEYSTTFEASDWSTQLSVYGGWSVAIEDEMIAVGAYGNDVTGFDSGSVDVLRFDGSSWQPTTRLMPSEPTLRNHYFGDTVHLDGDTLLVSAPGTATSSLFFNGEVYVYDADITLGTSYCGPSAVNSTGAGAEIRAFGSTSLADDDFRLGATGLPPLVFGFFLASQTTGFTVQPGGSQGNLCLDGEVGRFLASVQNSGLSGSLSFDVDLAAIPQPNGAVAAVVGDTWAFQAWYRDANPGVTSNLSNGLEVVFE